MMIYERNYDRICALENRLNDASEKHVSDRLNNYLKTDLLNSEKMTPLFLRLAQEKNNAALSEICDDNGVPFVSSEHRYG
jgi:hypothetical protein